MSTQQIRCKAENRQLTENSTYGLSHIHENCFESWHHCNITGGPMQPLPSQPLSLHDNLLLKLCDLQMSITMMIWQAAAYLLTTPPSHPSSTPPVPAQALLWSEPFHPCFSYCLLSNPRLLLGADTFQHRLLLFLPGLFLHGIHSCVIALRSMAWHGIA